MSVCVKVGIEKSNDPQYGDKNILRVVLTPGMDGYIPNGDTPNSSPPVGGGTPPVNNGGGATVPNWAKG